MMAYLSRPPSFKLESDGNLWANVTSSTSQEEPVHHKVIYRTVQKQTTVCLVHTRDNEVPFISSLDTRDNEVPFISSLEATYIPEEINVPVIDGEQNHFCTSTTGSK